MVQILLIAVHALLGGLPETGSCLGTEALQSLFAGTSRTELKLWRQLCRKASEHTLSLGDFCESSAESQPMAGGGQGLRVLLQHAESRIYPSAVFSFPFHKCSFCSSHGWCYCL